MKKGVTLIEVLVASTILAISVGATLSSFVIFDRISLNNSYKREAYAILQSNLEYYCGVNGNIMVHQKIVPFSEKNRFKTAGNGSTNYEIIITGQKKKKGLGFSRCKKQNYLMEVVGTISWLSPMGNNEKVELTTYIPYENILDEDI